MVRTYASRVNGRPGQKGNQTKFALLNIWQTSNVAISHILLIFININI